MKTIEALTRIQRCMSDEASRLSDGQVRELLQEAHADAGRYMGGSTKTEGYVLEVMLGRLNAGDTHWQLARLADIFLEYFKVHPVG